MVVRGQNLVIYYSLLTAGRAKADPLSRTCDRNQEEERAHIEAAGSRQRHSLGDSSERLGRLSGMCTGENWDVKVIRRRGAKRKR